MARLLVILAMLAACSPNFESLQGGLPDAGSGDETTAAVEGTPDSGTPQDRLAVATGEDSGGKTSTSEAGGEGTPDSQPPTTCVPRSTGGLACPGGKCTLGSYSGSSFAVTDERSSTACLSASSLCAAGTTNSLDSTDTSANWGATFGFYLRPESTPSASFEVALTGTGVAVTLSSLPTGARTRVQLTTGNLASSVDYCATLTSASQVVPWRNFNTSCWDGSGTYLTGTPSDAKAFAVQVVSEAGVAGTFDLCVTSLAL